MKRIAIVGTGYRSLLLAKGMQTALNNKVKIIAVCDINKSRLNYYSQALKGDIKGYTDFNLMIEESCPDLVMVTTIDSTHHEYIIKALEKGCDVLCEKPITTDEIKGKMIREAERKSGKKVLVTFNCRFMPPLIRIKELVMQGAVGNPLAINYEYFLNKAHGGDYFKRWHRFMENSGGMLVHKSTHHFDIANWIIGDEPVSVNAFGNRVYYGDNSKKLGQRCSECSPECLSYEDYKANKEYNNLYFKAEHEDGYIRDYCCFNTDTDIYDNMSVNVRYKKGALLTYSLNLFSPYEGYKISVTGDKGRIEINEPDYTNTETHTNHKIKLFLPKQEHQIIFVPKESGNHDGADKRLLSMLFGDNTKDTLGQCANSFEGLKSALIGICANKCIRENKVIDLIPYINDIR